MWHAQKGGRRDLQCNGTLLPRVRVDMAAHEGGCRARLPHNGALDIYSIQQGRLMKLPIRETDLQQQIIEGLRWHGYEVQTTQEKRRRCSQCGSYSHAGTGVAQGIADLLVRHPEWPPALWLQLEVKIPGGRLTPAQSKSLRCGGLFLIYSLEEAMENCRLLDRFFSEVTP